MKVKVFQTNHNGKIELTPAELEKLLNETFKEGYREGYREPRFNGNFGNFEKWPKNVSNANSVPCRQELTITPAEKSISQSVNETASASTTVGSDPNTGTTAAPLTCSIKVNNTDMQALAKSIEEIISEASKVIDFSKPSIDFSKPSNDVFANLAKELNF